jgi:hypothetical protein
MAGARLAKRKPKQRETRVRMPCNAALQKWNCRFDAHSLIDELKYGI